MRVQYATVTEVNTLFIILISPNASARLCLERINSLISLIANVNFVHNVDLWWTRWRKWIVKVRGTIIPFPSLTSLPFLFPSISSFSLLFQPSFPLPFNGVPGYNPQKIFSNDRCTYRRVLVDFGHKINI